MGMWPSSGHAMMDNAFHTEDMGLLSSLHVLYTLSLAADGRGINDQCHRRMLSQNPGSITSPTKEAVYLT